MENKEERAEAFVNETLVHFDTLHEGTRAYARSHPTSTELLALSIRSLPVTEKHIHASIERLEQRQRAMYDGDARSRERWVVGRSGDQEINTGILRQYCHLCAILPQDFYIGASEYASQEVLRGGAVFRGFFAHLTSEVSGRL